MDKKDLTKIALMGVASGLILGGQAEANETTPNIEVNTIIAKGGCGSKCGSSNNTSHRNRRYNPTQSEQGSCAGKGGCGAGMDGTSDGNTDNDGQPHNMNGQPKTQGNCSGNGQCNGMNNPNNMNTPPSASCGTSHGCGGN